MVPDEQHLDVRKVIGLNELRLRFPVHVAGDERVKVAERAQDGEPQLVRALITHRRINVHRRRAVRDLRHLSDIMDIHAVALGERFDPGAVALACVNVS